MGEHPALRGRCQCGGIRYEIAAPPRRIYVCHCTECRRQSSSAFGISVIVPAAAIRVLQGTPKAWSRPTHTGDTLDCHFCPDCGSRLWHVGRDDAETASVKGGLLDAPPDLSAAYHIWTRSKLPGVVIPPDAERYPEEPPGD